MQPKKYNKELIEKALPYLNQGYSWRTTAEVLKVPRTTLSDHLRVYFETQDETIIQQEGANILLLDIESSPAIAAAFGRFKQFLSQDNIISEGGHVLCAAYKWLGQSDVELVHVVGQSLLEIDDLPVILHIWELFNKADAIVCHNAKGFDFPMIQARVLYHGLPPLPHVKVIDTLIMAKKNFRLPNNKLDSISAYLGVDRKGDSGGILTWLNYMSGDEQAIDEMHTYCIQDVHVLEQVYLRLRAFGHTGSEYNAAHYYEDSAMRCHVCGSTDIEPTGRSVFTAVSEFAEHRCNHCNGVSRSRKPLNDRAKRANIVVQPKI